MRTPPGEKDVPKEKWDEVGTKHDACDRDLVEGGKWSEVVLLNKDPTVEQLVARSRRKCPITVKLLESIPEVRQLSLLCIVFLPGSSAPMTLGNSQILQCLTGCRHREARHWGVYVFCISTECSSEAALWIDKHAFDMSPAADRAGGMLYSSRTRAPALPRGRDHDLR